MCRRLPTWPVVTFLMLGLMGSAGCGDLGGGKRRNAGGSAAGAGLVGSDVNSLASGATQPAGPQGAVAPAVTPNPGAMMPNAQPGAAAPQPGAPAVPLAPGAGPVEPTAQTGSLPGLPGVTLPGQPQPNTATEKAQVGVSGKGDYGGAGMVTTPISVYFQVQERVVFLKVQHAMNLFHADKGYKPRTEAEFMKEIIEFNQIRLPQLPPGSKYKYDPQSGDLLVEHPQQ